MERSARDDLAMIRKLMEESRQTLDAGGPHFVVWGLLITAGLLGTYASAVGAVELNGLWLWGGTVGAGWVLSMIIGTRTARRADVTSVGGRLTASIWIGAGVAMTLLGFVGMPTRALGSAGGSLGAMAAVMGAACFASATVQRSGGLRAAAVIWWLGAVAMFVWSGLLSLLVMAGLMVVLHLVPGIWLTMKGTRTAPAEAA